MSPSPSPLGTQLDPRTAAWYAEQLKANEEYYNSFAPYLQGLADERTQLQSDLTTGQAEEQQLMQRGPQGPTPMESFAGRLAGGISQAIAPQMNGQALAEREIQGREEQAAQRHAIKLQRLMKINERMAERAEKIGDLETAAKLNRENLKLQKDMDAREKAVQFAQAQEQATATERRHRETLASARRSELFKAVELRASQMEDVYTKAQAALQTVLAGRKGKNGKLEPATPAAINAAQRRLERADRDRTAAQRTVSAFLDGMATGTFDPNVYKNSLAQREEADAATARSNAAGYVSDYIAEAEGNGKGGNFLDLVKWVSGMHEEQYGYPLPTEDQALLKEAWQAARKGTSIPAQPSPIGTALGAGLDAWRYATFGSGGPDASRKSWNTLLDLATGDTR